MVSKAQVLNGDWKLLRIEIAPHDADNSADNEFESYDGYSRFWCPEAVLGAYWVLEKVEDTTVRLHLAEEIELEGFREALSFKPDLEFKRELLSRCDWESVVRQVFPDDKDAEIASQLSLFEGDEDE